VKRARSAGPWQFRLRSYRWTRGDSSRGRVSPQTTPRAQL